MIDTGSPSNQTRKRSNVVELTSNGANRAPSASLSVSTNALSADERLVLPTYISRKVHRLRFVRDNVSRFRHRGGKAMTKDTLKPTLMQGNEAIAEELLQQECVSFSGYPISLIRDRRDSFQAFTSGGRDFIQMEDEIASIPHLSGRQSLRSNL